VNKQYKRDSDLPQRPYIRTLQDSAAWYVTRVLPQQKSHNESLEYVSYRMTLAYGTCSALAPCTHGFSSSIDTATSKNAFIGTSTINTLYFNALHCRRAGDRRGVRILKKLHPQTPRIISIRRSHCKSVQALVFPLHCDSLTLNLGNSNEI